MKKLILGLSALIIAIGCFRFYQFAKLDNVNQVLGSEQAFGGDVTQGLLNPWIASSSIAKLIPRNSSFGLRVPSLASAGDCLTTDGNGTFSTSACGTGGGGGGSTTTIAGLTPSNGVFTLATGSTTGLNLNITTTSPRTITFAPALQSGYNIPLSASTTQWAGLINNPVWNVGSGIVYNATSTDKIGIGTSTPSYPVTIASSTYIGGPLTLSNAAKNTTLIISSPASTGPESLGNEILFKPQNTFYGYGIISWYADDYTRKDVIMQTVNHQYNDDAFNKHFSIYTSNGARSSTIKRLDIPYATDVSNWLVQNSTFEIDGIGTSTASQTTNPLFFINNGFSTSTVNQDMMKVVNGVANPSSGYLLNMQQYGTNTAISIVNQNPSTQVGANIDSSGKFGFKHSVTGTGGYALNLSSDGVHSISNTNGFAKLFQATTFDTNPVLTIDSRGSGAPLKVVNNTIDYLTVLANRNVGVGTATPTSLLYVQNVAAASTTPLLTVASATGTSLFNVGYNGSTTIASLNSASCDVMADTNGLLYCGTNGSGGGVTSVDMTVPTGLTVSGNPITTSGTLAVALQSGYNIPLTASTTNWNSFFDTPSTRITAGTNLVWSSNTLNVTSTPTFSGGLTVSGTSTLATTTVTNLTVSQPPRFSSITGSTQCLHVDSSGNTSGTGSDCGAGGGGVTGGTNGYVARWTGATTLSTGLLIDNGTVTGVNASSSTVTFNIQGSPGVNPFNIASSSGTSLLTVLANGNVGIGTSTPGKLLVVNGNTQIMGTLTDAAGNAYSTSTGGSGFIDWQKTAGNLTIPAGGTTTVFSTTLPGGTIKSGQCIRIDVGWKKVAGANTATFAIVFGSVSTTLISGAGNSFVQGYALICNDPGSTAAQSIVAMPFSGNPPTTNISTAAADTTVSQDVILRVTGTAADLVTPEFWHVVAQ